MPLAPVSPADRARRRDGTGGADPPGDRRLRRPWTLRSRPVEPAVVQIDTTIDYQHAIGAGTGFVLNPGGEVLTNFHVVQGADASPRTASAPADPSPPTWSATTAHTTSRFCSCAAHRACPSRRWATRHSSSVGEPAVAIGNATRRPADARSGHHHQLGRTIDAKDALTGSSDELTGLIEVAAPRPRGRLRRPAGERRRPGDRHDHGGDRELPVRAPAAKASRSRSTRRWPSPTRSARGRRPTRCTSGRPRCSVSVSPRRSGRRRRPASSSARRCAAVRPRLPALSTATSSPRIDGAPLDSATALTQMLDRHYPGDVVDLTWIDRSGQQRTGKATLAS